MEPKFEPVIVTEVPLAPELSEVPKMLAAKATVKVTPLLEVALLVTTTAQLDVPFGTSAAILAEVHETIDAATPLNVTVPVEPKLLPAMLTSAPVGPAPGDKLVMFGRMVNGVELLETPEACTVKGAEPGPAGLGTMATIEVEVQFEIVAVAPPKLA